MPRATTAAERIANSGLLLFPEGDVVRWTSRCSAPTPPRS
jgi:hypothetical protein